MVGPQLPGAAPGNRGNYGGFLRPGEGDAMAAYVQSGKRIPRRGEVRWVGARLFCESRAAEMGRGGLLCVAAQQGAQALPGVALGRALSAPSPLVLPCGCLPPCVGLNQPPPRRLIAQLEGVIICASAPRPHLLCRCKICTRCISYTAPRSRALCTLSAPGLLLQTCAGGPDQ